MLTFLLIIHIGSYDVSTSILKQNMSIQHLDHQQNLILLKFDIQRADYCLNDGKM